MESKSKRFYIDEKEFDKLKSTYCAVDIEGICNRLLEYFEEKPFKTADQTIYNSQIKDYIIIRNNKPEIKEDNFQRLDKEIKVITKEELKEIYNDLINIQKYYIDTSEDNYKIVALWIIGSWMHNEFPTFPYLYFQAMRGSGKTRYLKLIKELSWKGDMLTSLSEAVLFRTTGTLCIDEFESVGSKDKNALRELLNTAYKKGGKVKRMKKVKNFGGESQEVEEFDTYRPVAMANIWGMEEVLGDRCITIILEKSSNKAITRKIENFENNELIKKLHQNFAFLSPECSLCSVVTKKNIIQEWNDYITTLNYTTTLNTQTTQNNTNQNLFKKIDETEIDGRNLELTFPLILIADELNILEEFIEIVKKVIMERKETEFMESKDVMLYSFISKQEPNTWYKIKELELLFRNDIGYDNNEESWLNSKWLGRALKRLNLTIDKRRMGVGVEVILNTLKAEEKMMIFK